MLTTLDSWKVLAHPDEEREGQGGDPPLGGNWVESDKVGVGKVEEEGGACGLEDEAEVEHPVGHALLEDGQYPSFADDHVRPLDLQAMGYYYGDHGGLGLGHLDDGEEVGAVASELESAPLRVGPLLAPAVLHHRVLVLPLRVGPEKLSRQPGEGTMQITVSITVISPSIGSHNDQVDKEAGHGLGDADHTVGEED